MLIHYITDKSIIEKLLIFNLVTENRGEINGNIAAKKMIRRSKKKERKRASITNV